jgi:hypothetical protein
MCSGGCDVTSSNKFFAQHDGIKVLNIKPLFEVIALLGMKL